VLAVTAARAAAPSSGTSTRDGCIAASCAGAAVRAGMPPPAEEEEAAAGGGGVTEAEAEEEAEEAKRQLEFEMLWHSARARCIPF
jgi:hypothetical protein